MFRRRKDEQPAQVEDLGAAEVDDDAVAHDLAGQRGARRARNQADAVLVGESDEFAHIGFRPRKCDGDGHFLILRGVRRI